MLSLFDHQPLQVKIALSCRSIVLRVLEMPPLSIGNQYSVLRCDDSTSASGAGLFVVSQHSTNCFNVETIHRQCFRI